MLDYYRRRGPPYEAVYARPERQADLRLLEAALPPLFAGRRVLELACGTGWWTGHGARDARRWLATDLNPEAMALAQAKPAAGQAQALLGARGRALHWRDVGAYWWLDYEVA